MFVTQCIFGGNTLKGIKCLLFNNVSHFRVGGTLLRKTGALCHFRDAISCLRTWPSFWIRYSDKKRVFFMGKGKFDLEVKGIRLSLGLHRTVGYGS